VSRRGPAVPDSPGGAVRSQTASCNREHRIPAPAFVVAAYRRPSAGGRACAILLVALKAKKIACRRPLQEDRLWAATPGRSPVGGNPRKIACGRPLQTQDLFDTVMGLGPDGLRCCAALPLRAMTRSTLLPRLFRRTRSTSAGRSGCPPILFAMRG